MIELQNCRARVLGNDINTDYIISSRRKRESLDPAVLSRYLFEDIDTAFAASVLQGDILVAGDNFGCGSAMEVAATVVLGAGIRAVLARSFSRTYYRNAVNNGLFPIAVDTDGIAEGDQLSVKGSNGQLVVLHHRTGSVRQADPLPTVMASILQAGGIVPYFAKYKNFVV
jgi:3-isopropylmalate/(R)-2-methylmalate dehydratase small subunit